MSEMEGRKRDRDDRFGASSNKSRRMDDNEPICTVHVSGLPADVKTRELRNLATFLPGFEGAIIHNKSSRDMETQIGFIKFVNQKSAVAALQVLHGHVFDDQESNNTLRVSMAKRNMNVSRSSRASLPLPMQFNPYMQVPGYEGFDGYYHGGPGYDMHASSHASSHGSSHGHAAVQSTSSLADAPVISNTRGNPCDTLCIQGMTPWTSQGDVEAVFRELQGFKDIKVFGQKGLGFVRFESEKEAGNAMDELDGATVQLPGADNRTSMRIEYAKRSLEERPPRRDRES